MPIFNSWAFNREKNHRICGLSSIKARLNDGQWIGRPIRTAGLVVYQRESYVSFALVTILIDSINQLLSNNYACTSYEIHV
jgi:hypothetical protein